MFDFHFQNGNARRRLHQVKGSHCTIGSARDNDLVVDTRRISKRHAELREERDGIYLRDLGSLGGCRVNGERIIEHGPLSSLDEIEVGDVRVTLRSVGASGSAQNNRDAQLSAHGLASDAHGPASDAHDPMAANDSEPLDDRIHRNQFSERQLNSADDKLSSVDSVPASDNKMQPAVQDTPSVTGAVWYMSNCCCRWTCVARMSIGCLMISCALILH